MTLNSTDDAYDAVTIMMVAFLDLFKAGVVAKEDGVIMVDLSERAIAFLDLTMLVAEERTSDD